MQFASESTLLQSLGLQKPLKQISRKSLEIKNRLPNSWAWIFKPIGTVKPDKNLIVSLQLQSMANIRSGNGYITTEIYAKNLYL